MPTQYALDNGLTVAFEEQHAARVVAFQLWVRAGSADERPDQAGLAHLHEHMLFKGTARRGPGQIAHEVEALGGEVNAWTSFDQTVYHLVIASPFARAGLDILADAVRHSAFDAAELAREIEVVCEEIKRSEDIPARRASRDLFSTAYRIHPYGRPVLGTEGTVRGFTRDKVLEFYERHYTPGNVVLAGAGDLEPAMLRDWAQALLGGDWGRRLPGPVARAPEPAGGGRRVLLRGEEVKEAYLHLGFPGPTAKDEDAPALDVLAMIAGQGEASRLFLEVKRKRSLVNDINASSYTPRDPGLWTASLTAPPPQLPGALEETARVLAQLRAQPVSSDELSTVQSLIESEAIYQRETVQGLARKLGFYQSELGSLEEEARYYAKIAQLTPERVQEVAQRTLRFDQAVVTGLFPPGNELSEGKVHQILDRAAAETMSAPYARKGVKPSAGLQVTSALSSHRRAGEVVVERLPSGAQVVVREETAVPLFGMRGAFVGGIRFESEQNNGLTTLLSRMLTRGTPSHDAEEISHWLDRMSGSMAGGGGRNSVSLSGEFLSKHFDRAFELFADCLNAPSFPEAEFARERQLLSQDIVTREDKPSALAFDLLAKTLYQRHPYRLSLFGEIASVERLAPQELAQFHARWLDPSQLTLCVVGDVQIDNVLERASAAFGRSRGGARPAPEVPADPKPSGPRAGKLSLSRAQAHLVLGFPGLKVSDPGRRALEVLSTVLSGQGGRLFLELRDKRSLAYSVSSFAVEGLDPGHFAVYIGTSPEKLDAARQGIHAELQRLLDEPVPPAELDRAKRHLVGSHEIGLQRNSARAGLLALDYCYGLGGENFLRYSEQVAAVTADAVLACARRVIDFHAMAEAVVGP